MTSRIPFAVPLLLLLAGVIQAAHAQPLIKGATNGTIGPKRAIETPLENLIRGSAPVSPTKPLVTAPRNPIDGTSMKKVLPGLVKWHPDFASALSAATASGRPILLFQMMGNLDEEFC